MPTGSQRPFAERAGALFVGSFGHAPNLDAVEWLLGEIWPLVLEAEPELRLTVVGSDPPAWLSATERPGVDVAGEVPDVDVFLDRALVSVAPLRFGAGVKGKVLASMARGVPVVGSPIALEGIPAAHERDVLAAEGAEETAAAVVRLAGDAELWERLSADATALVAERFSPEAARTALELALSPELARA